MDPIVPQKPNGQPATIGGIPEPTLHAGGNVLEGLQAAIAAEQAPHGPAKETLVADLHNEEHGIPKLRTFESDAAEAVQKHSVSSVSIAAQKIQEKSVEPEIGRTEIVSNAIKNVAMILGALILIGGSCGAVWYAFVVSQPKQASVLQSNPSNNVLIGVDDVKTVSMGQQQNSLDAFMQGANLLATEKGTIVQISITAAGTSTSLDAGTFLSDLNANNMPSWLPRAVGPGYVAGFYHNATSWNPFMLFSVSSYDNAFAAMLQWEANLGSDLAPLYQKSSTSTAPTIASTTTATSSTPKNTPVILSLPPAWSDVFIANKDTRALGIPGQKPLLLYAFPTQNVLVITTSQEAAIEIFDRLVARQFVH